MMCDSPFHVLPKGRTKSVPVPCGRCPPCKRRRVNSWVFRLLEEDKVSSSSHFITLTYDTRTVPISGHGYMTLHKPDFQDFMKRLRKLTTNNVKYYAVGEYGSKTERPHYHAIVFNVPDKEMFMQAWTLNGQQIGSVHVGNTTGDSIAYCMKYIDKDEKRRYRHRDDRIPEFSLMSKGLGASYITDATKRYHSDISKTYITKEGGYKIAIPRYYAKILYTDEQRRQQAYIAESARMEQDQKDRAQFARYGYSEQYTYEDYVDRRRYARHKTFYNNQKNRDI